MQIPYVLVLITYVYYIYICISIYIYTTWEMAETMCIYLSILEREIGKKRKYIYTHIYIWLIWYDICESVHVATCLLQSTARYRCFKQLILLPRGVKPPTYRNLFWVGFRAKSLGQTWSNLASFSTWNHPFPGYKRLSRFEPSSRHSHISIPFVSVCFKVFFFAEAYPKQ